MIATETTPPQIVGFCASACTMHLLTGCVAPGAVLVFHGPHWASGRQMSDAAFDRLSRRLASYYPPAIAAWFMAEGRFGQWRMSGADAIAAGARQCSEGGTQ